MTPDEAPEPVTNALLKIDAKILTLAYKDLAQPGVQQVGKALSTVLGLGNTALLPLKLVNEKAQLWFASHMEKYRKQLEQVPEEQVAEVPPEIGGPILEKLEKTTNERLSDLYINLLAGASVASTAGLAHPRFAQIIESLAPDEAKVLDYMWQQTPAIELPYIQVSASQYSRMDEQESPGPSPIGIILKPVTILSTRDYLAYPQNAHLYLNNLLALGLIKTEDNRTLPDQTDYNTLQAYYKDQIDFNIGSFVNYHKLSRAHVMTYMGFYELTDLGISFLRACSPKDESVITRSPTGQPATGTRPRYCDVFKAQDGHYYVRLESAPATEQYTYYGPFDTPLAVQDYLRQTHSIQESFYLDETGRRQVPVALGNKKASNSSNHSN